MRNLSSAIILCVSLSACSLLDSRKASEEINHGASALSGSATSEVLRKNETLHHAAPPQRNVNFYIRGLMQELVSNLQYVNERTPVAVADFVLLDSDLTTTTLLGKQIAESLIHEIHKFGIPVLDYKTREQIKVSDQGDFLFSREHPQNEQSLPIHYVFSGTLVKHQGGYLINARVIGLSSKAVIASAQTFIPAEVGNALLADPSKASKPRKKTILLEKQS